MRGMNEVRGPRPKCVRARIAGGLRSALPALVALALLG